MDCRTLAIGWSLFGLLASLPGIATAADGRPLRLGLNSVASSFPHTRDLSSLASSESGPAGHMPVRAERQPPRDGNERDAPLGRRALQSVFEAPDPDNEDVARQPQLNERFRFERRGNAGRDLARGYRDVCARISDKVWDDPNGRRLKFDIAGKPGVALVIPLR